MLAQRCMIRSQKENCARSLTTEYSRLYIGVTVTQGEVRKIEELPSPVTPEDRGEHAPENKTVFANKPK